MLDNPGYSCPRYEGCNVPYCPALGGKHLAGEAVCPYLLEVVKEGGEELVRGELGRELADIVVAQGLSNGGEAATTLHPTIRAQLKQAAKSGSRIRRGREMACRNFHRG